MSASSQSGRQAVRALADLYPAAVSQVYGYLLPRCGDVTVAEELTAESFLAAAAAARRGAVAEVTVAWLIGIARHKLVDHWRRSERERRSLSLVSGPDDDDPWDAFIEVQRAHEVLSRLSTPHRSALTLRYLDGLPVADVAAQIGRSLHATETLLVRARAAFRRSYEDRGESDEG